MNRLIDISKPNGCTKLNEPKFKAPKSEQHGIYLIYRNGQLESVERTRKAVLRYCDENMFPFTTLHVRTSNKLVYFHEFGHEPIFFNGFHIASWKNKPYPKALIDYDNHTPREVTEQYEVITRALEQSAEK